MAELVRAFAVAVVALVLIGAAAWRASRVWDRHQRALADPRAFLRERMDLMSDREARFRFARYTATEWPDGIKPAPPQPQPSTLDAHFGRLADEVVPDTAIDGEDPR